MNESLLPENESNDPEYETVKRSAKQLIDRYAASSDQIDMSTVDDWEVDELLEWTNALDFNSYLNNWKRIGTTKNSST